MTERPAGEEGLPEGGQEGCRDRCSERCPEPCPELSLRLHSRYMEEVVLRFHLCPWAERALSSGAVSRAVVREAIPSLDAVASLVEAWERTDTVEVGFLIFPAMTATVGAFDRFAEQLRRQLGTGAQPRPERSFVVAAFHPDAGGAAETPQQLVATLRRTPDPTLQLIRGGSLDSAARSWPGGSDAIAAHNHATIRACGLDQLLAVTSALRRERLNGS